MIQVSLNIVVDYNNNQLTLIIIHNISSLMNLTERILTNICICPLLFSLVPLSYFVAFLLAPCSFFCCGQCFHMTFDHTFMCSESLPPHCCCYYRLILTVFFFLACYKLPADTAAPHVHSLMQCLPILYILLPCFYNLIRIFIFIICIK